MTPADTENVPGTPRSTVVSRGCTDIVGNALMKSLPPVLVAWVVVEPSVRVTATVYDPVSAIVAELMA